MNARWSVSPAQRAQRKQDLLLASRLVRLHADAALNDLGTQVDRWDVRIRTAGQFVRHLGAHPGTLAGASALALGLATWRRRGAAPGARARVFWLRAWSAGWTAWRLWRAWVGVQRRMP